MPTTRPFRFGVVAATVASGEAWLEKARRVEALGFSTLVMPDGLRYSLSPLPALAAAAAVTSTLRLGTYVLANDYRNPVILAKDAATLDFVSGGRFELGIGAGRPGAEEDNRMLGVPFESGATRLARLAESLAIVKALLASEEVTASGAHYSVVRARIDPQPVQRPRPPILVAASGNRMLELAAKEADVVALGVPQTATADDLAARIAVLRAAAGERFSELELNINLMAVGQQVPRYVSMQLGLTAEALAAAGAATAVTGSVDRMCESLLERRAALGISYIMVGDELMDALAPVVARLAGR